MTMIYDRSLRNECTTNASLVALITVVFSVIIFTIRLLNEVNSGVFEASALGPLLIFAIIKFLPILVPLSCFLGALLTLSRWYRDSEMAVWFSSGLPLKAFIRPVILFSIPLMIITGLITQTILPWAYGASNKVKEKLSASREVNFSKPGVFKELNSGNRVLYIESANNDTNRAKNVFISDIGKESLGIVVAKSAREVIYENGDRFIFLENGHRYDLNHKTNTLKEMQYDEYGIRIETSAQRVQSNFYDSMTTFELLMLGTPQALGDVVIRVGLVLMSLILPLLAIPIAYANPRAGRSASMLIALLTYFTYYNLMTLSRSWVAHEKVNFILGLSIPHLSMILAATLLIHVRSKN